jgi:hypothetical protein
MLELKDVKIKVDEKDESFILSVFEYLKNSGLKTVEEWNMVRSQFFCDFPEKQKLLTVIFDYSGIIKKFKLRRTTL